MTNNEPNNGAEAIQDHGALTIGAADVLVRHLLSRLANTGSIDTLVRHKSLVAAASPSSLCDVTDEGGRSLVCCVFDFAKQALSRDAILRI